MNKLLWRIVRPSRLGIAMLQYVLAAALAACLCYVISTNGLDMLAGMLTDQKNYYQKHTQMLADEFQDFVNENQISITDSDQLNEWNYDNWYVFFTAYRGEQVYYNTMDAENRDLKMELKEEYPSFQHSNAYRHDNSLSYSILFADGEGQIQIRAYFEARFRTLILSSSILFSALCFVAIFLLMLQKKLRYITQIEKGIRILEEGVEETYRIPEKGRDELYSLAVSINQMSDSLHREIEEKDRLETERNEMVTSLSHDIRTPLTSVLFYLDLIADGKCTKDQESLYTQKAKKQAYYMKLLMDELFSYSYVGKGGPVSLEDFDGNELFGQLAGELAESLEERGYEVNVRYDIEKAFRVKADASQLKRVFDNLGSNIGKYAVKEAVITIDVTLEDGCVCLYQSNEISRARIEAESYGIGVKASKRLVEQMGGSFYYSSNDHLYEAWLKLPVL